MEHSSKLLTYTKLPPVFKTFVLSVFEWWLKTGFYCNIKPYFGFLQRPHNISWKSIVCCKGQVIVGHISKVRHFLHSIQLLFWFLRKVAKLEKMVSAANFKLMLYPFHS